MTPIKQQLQKALRALEFANAGSLARLEAMLESREVETSVPQPKVIEPQAACGEPAPVLPFPAYRMAQAAGRR